MTKQHFIALADAIRPTVYLFEDYEQTGEVSETVAALAHFCQMQNPRFDRKRWFDYLHGLCGPSGGKVKA